MTRRDLLQLAAQAGGVSFAYGLMEELSLVVKPEPTDLDSLKGATARKATVVILGAGIAGMCAAYELEQLGYHCILLEARHRTGGRCYSIRAGDTVEEAGLKQVCEFEKGAFFNPGPTRVPYWHITIYYCRKFNVALAPWINVNEGAYMYQTTAGNLKGQKMRIRDVIADTTGTMAELVSRSVSADQADLSLSQDEKLQVLTYMNRYGFLDRDGKYRGKQRRSYESFSGAGPEESRYGKPYELKDLSAAALGGYFHFINANDQQMSMLEIVGGVDQLARAFEQRVKSSIRFGCQVADIKTSAKGVKVAYKDARGDSHQVAADFCICTIPLSVLKKIPANFDAGATSAIVRALYPNSTKVATEYKRRFWEEDERLFGGITWTDLPIGQVIYPSHNYFSKSGVLVNYTLGRNGGQLAGMEVDKRVQAALGMMSQIHPQAPKEFKSGVTLSWAKVPFNEGAFVSWEFTPNGEEAYQQMCKPQGRLYFAGEHASRITTWMAGAIESARFAVKKVAIQAQAMA